MKKRGIISIGITFLVLSIIVGIASLPDEVLLESSTNENSQNVPEDIQLIPTEEEMSNFVSEPKSQKNMEKINAEINSLKKEIDELKKELNYSKTSSDIPEEVLQVTEMENKELKVSETKNKELEDESDGKVITVNISDGVGVALK